MLSYNTDRWKLLAKQKQFWAEIAKDHDHFSWCYQDFSRLRACLNDTVYIHPRHFCQKHRVADMVAWYYIDQLDIKDFHNVIDVGCGINPFKPYIKNLTGMDCDQSLDPDQVDFFDDEYASNNANLWDRIISINSIHFASIEFFVDRINYLGNMLKPTGKAYVATNLETWLMHTPCEKIQEIFGKLPGIDEILTYLDICCRSVTGLAFKDITVTIVDTNYGIRDDLNGNIRLIIER